MDSAGTNMVFDIVSIGLLITHELDFRVSLCARFLATDTLGPSDLNFLPNSKVCFLDLIL